MCYNIAGLALSKYKLAVRRRYDEKVIEDLWQEYERLRKIYAVPEYFVNGWAKPTVLINTNLETGQFIPDHTRFRLALGIPSHLRRNPLHPPRRSLDGIYARVKLRHLMRDEKFSLSRESFCFKIPV